MAAAETIALLEQCFTEEALRRMCRKAGVLSIARKSDLSLNDQIRSAALLMLSNICSKSVILMEHKRVLTLDTDVVDRSLKALSVKMPAYVSEPTDARPCRMYALGLGGRCVEIPHADSTSRAALMSTVK